jgi:predicted dithiol-disulfide oxidoreductase (DUF899 family)
MFGVPWGVSSAGMSRASPGIDLFTPVWNLFDLLPEGRDDWTPIPVM